MNAAVVPMAPSKRLQIADDLWRGIEVLAALLKQPDMFIEKPKPLKQEVLFE